MALCWLLEVPLETSTSMIYPSRIIENFDPSNSLKHSLKTSGGVNSLQLSNSKLVSAEQSNTIKVWNLQTGKALYSLLGGSLQRRANNPEHPLKPGASHVEIDESRVIGSFNSLLRVYDFEVFKPQ